MGPGTLYPMLHALEREGYLASRVEGMGGARRLYRPTRTGRAALKLARHQVRELFGELDEEQ